ncbi:MAG: 4-amino-4-deoxychorismate lyase [Symploca sp. SIO2C1]|nr:4-amino-4-deoxychorismate lyase [Symploca sp. SIO2C1]
MFWYNGQLIQGNSLELVIDDPGLIYGATVFTTLRVYHQSLEHPLTNWKGHCDRILGSLQAFGWQLPDQKQLQQGAEALLSLFPVLRITIFPDGREWITGRYLPVDLTQRQQQGITAWLADTPELIRSLPAHKTGNYLTAWLALQQAQQQGAQEAILVDVTGNWVETSTGNLWGWQDGCWWIPPLIAGILPGTVRSQLINWLQKQGLVVRETAWDKERLLTLEAIAYTNSVVEVIPIHTILTPHQSLTYESSHPSLEQLRSWFVEAG